MQGGKGRKKRKVADVSHVKANNFLPWNSNVLQIVSVVFHSASIFICYKLANKKRNENVKENACVQLHSWHPV